jgi:cbb3-type cytochrome oxidase subunit 3
LLNIEPIDPPIVTVWPEKYIAGEEVFYIEGQALPGVDIIISLRKNGQDVKEWQTQSNEQGEWFFSTKELVKSGIYDLFVKAQDQRGAVSNTSDIRKIEALLSGFSLGIFTVSFKNIISFLLLVLFLGIILVVYFIYKVRRTKKILQKETQEAKKSLYIAFETLEKKIKKQIEMFDLRPGLSKKEEKLYNGLKKDLEIVQDFIAKEIKDIEKELD